MFLLLLGGGIIKGLIYLKYFIYICLCVFNLIIIIYIYIYMVHLLCATYGSNIIYRTLINVFNHADFYPYI